MSENPVQNPEIVTDGESDAGESAQPVFTAAETSQRAIFSGGKEVADQIQVAKVAVNGIFKHPSTCTEEEEAIIVNGLRAHLPLAVIGKKIHCERHFLARYIQSHPELAQVQIDSREDMVDAAEFQIDKLARQGNVPAVMMILERLGKSRGWSQTEEKDVKEDDTHIVFGEIGEADCTVADQIVAYSKGEAPPPKQVLDPSALAQAQEIAQAEVDAAEEAVRRAQEAPQEIQGGSVSPAPYEGTEGPSRASGDDYGGDDGGGMQFDDENNPDFAFAGGEYSPFGGF